MSWWRKMFKKANGVHHPELDGLRVEFTLGQQRLQRAAKKLSRAAETISRQRRENEMAESIERFRINEGAGE